MNFSLALSLGHNSSAVLISPTGKILGGYETERFDQIKSSSAFPIAPIERLMFEYGLDYCDIDTFISHWFTSGQLPSYTTKHCNLEVIRKFNSVSSLNYDLTHHDVHLESAIAFAGEEFSHEDTIAMVMDGFGTAGESTSIYKLTPHGYTLLHRVFGYDNSLGLLYQYATDYMGMKMNNHEYKILAYEVHINEILCDKEMLEIAAHNYATRLLKRMFTSKINRDLDPLVNISALQETQAMVRQFLQDTLEDANVDYNNIHCKRVATAFVVQKIVELVVLELRKLYPSSGLLLAGGLFYNVKLNSLLCDTAESFCVMPLAGDQGAGLGAYQAHRGDLQWPDHLFWGNRDLHLRKSDDGILVFDTMNEAMPFIIREFDRVGFANLVRGAMEFGPRALCNTSTLALPTFDVTQHINRINNRTAEMPMAPVVTEEQAISLFVGTEKVHKSLDYMILTRKYRSNDVAANMSGASHFYPDDHVFTGRPQVTRDPHIVHLLNEYGPLVNTSFNYHGLPIVFEEESIRHTHQCQKNHMPDIKTFVIKEPT